MSKTNFVIGHRRQVAGRLLVLLLVNLLLLCQHRFAHAQQPASPLTAITYDQRPLRMEMKTTREVTIGLRFERGLLPATGADVITLNLETQTLSPQFNILSLDPASARIQIPRKQLEVSGYLHEIRVKLHANYIGHALLRPKSLEIGRAQWPLAKGGSPSHQLDVTVVQNEGIWGVVFIVCVSVFMLISYINLGAQLDEENMRALIRQPKSLILGFLISVFVMPLIGWFVGECFLQKQPLFRIGSFIFACGPAASASTLWTVMLNSDKELSVGLQVLSTVGALFTMPMLLYLMDKSLQLNHEISHTIRVPYGRLMQTLFALLVALIIGWRLVGKNERLQKVSRQIFRPLVFSVLIFIIVFSSILYWHIYKMFDWNITLASLIITMLTYTISGMLGHCISCDLERAVAISISSAYKNSGIAFAVLLVAFDAPDTYIAYVPCLTQIVITSITLYLSYLVLALYNCVRRRGQPEPIQASQDTEAGLGAGAKGKRRGSSGAKAATGDAAGNSSPGATETEPGDTDEFIAMNVTDIDPDSMPTTPNTQGGYEDAPGQVSVKVIAGDNQESDDDDRQPGRRGTRV